jgi:hypothetical protein
MRIGEAVFAVYPRRERGNPLDNEENGPDGGSRGRPNDAMCGLAERAIRVPGTVRVEVRQLYGGTKYQQECEEGNEQSASKGTRLPRFVAQRHNYSRLYTRMPKQPTA